MILFLDSQQMIHSKFLLDSPTPQNSLNFN